MKRRDVLGLLLLGGPLSKTIWAYQQPAGQQPAGRGGQPQGPPTVEVEKLTDNLVLLRGGGGTTAVLLRGDGVTIVDTKNPKFGAPIIAAVKELTGRPITTIINTHCHGDHVSGNVEFPAIEVIAHEATAANMKNWKPVAGFPGAERNRSPASSSRTATGTCRRGPSATGSRSARGRIRSSCTSSGGAIRMATRGSCSRRRRSCTPATSSPGTIRFPFSTATTARAASRIPTR